MTEITNEVCEAVSAEPIKPHGNVGHTHSAETRAKISASKKGQPLAPAHLAAVRAAIAARPPWQGKHHSEASKQNISQHLSGRKLSAETKKKMSDAKKKFWAERKKTN